MFCSAGVLSCDRRVEREVGAIHVTSTGNVGQHSDSVLVGPSAMACETSL